MLIRDKGTRLTERLIPAVLANAATTVVDHLGEGSPWPARGVEASQRLQRAIGRSGQFVLSPVEHTDSFLEQGRRLEALGSGLLPNAQRRSFSRFCLGRRDRLFRQTAR